MQNRLCIIPARGGSKRIPRKNIKNFLGKPIIAYSIESAINSGLFTEIMVSTDDSEIADIAIQYGAVVPFMRSKENANDHATTMQVLIEVIDAYTAKGCSFDQFCCIYPTAPFVTEKTLKDAFGLFDRNNFDSLFPVMKYSFPIQRSLKKNIDSMLTYSFEETKNMRSQDLSDRFHDAGQFYWFKKEVLETDSIVTARTGGIEINELQGQDIDSDMDWKLAEMKYELLQSIK